MSGTKTLSLELTRAELLRTQNFIDGAWCEAREGRRFGVDNPADGAQFATVPVVRPMRRRQSMRPALPFPTGAAVRHASARGCCGAGMD
jgi:hypothetical protein